MHRRDVVCGMDVDEERAPTREYRGRRYWFCSPRCLETFEGDPQTYTRREEEREGREGEGVRRHGPGCRS